MRKGNAKVEQFKRMFNCHLHLALFSIKCHICTLVMPLITIQHQVTTHINCSRFNEVVPKVTAMPAPAKDSLLNPTSQARGILGTPAPLKLPSAVLSHLLLLYMNAFVNITPTYINTTRSHSHTRTSSKQRA